MKRSLSLALVLSLAPVATAADKELPKPMVTGLVNPESVCVGPGGRVFVTTIGEFGKDGDGAVYSIDPKRTVKVVVDEKKLPGLHTPTGVLNDGTSFLLLAEVETGILRRIKLADGTSEKVADLPAVRGIAWDWYGRLYITSW